jgi:hypothetical protein
MSNNYSIETHCIVNLNKSCDVVHYFLNGKRECGVIVFSNTHSLQHLAHLYTVTIIPNIEAIISPALNPGELT